MARALIIDAARTPFGRYRGGLSGIRVDDLAALPIVDLLRRYPGLDLARIDDVLLGDANGARHAASKVPREGISRSQASRPCKGSLR